MIKKYTEDKFINRLLNSPYADKRCQGLDMLKFNGDINLISKFTVDRAKSVKEKCVEVIASLDNWFNYLIALLNSPDPLVRSAVTDQFIEKCVSDEEIVIGGLLKKFFDTDFVGKEQILKTLKALSPNTMIPIDIFKLGLIDPKPSIVIESLECIEKYGRLLNYKNENFDCELLKALLLSDNKNIVISALNVIASLGDLCKTLESTIESIIDDNDDLIVMAGEKALFEINKDRTRATSSCVKAARDIRSYILSVNPDNIRIRKIAKIIQTSCNIEKVISLCKSIKDNIDSSKMSNNECLIDIKLINEILENLES